jgi:hypothetical protein
MEVVEKGGSSQVCVDFLELEQFGRSSNNLPLNRKPVQPNEKQAVEHHGDKLRRLAITTETLRELARALHVQPFDMLNDDPHTNDLGWLIEAMRLDPNVLRLAKAKLAARTNS